MTDNPNVPEPAYAYIPLKYHPAVLAVQGRLRELLQVDGMEWQDPATFHITLWHQEQLTHEDLTKSVMSGFEPFEVRVAHIGFFNNPEKRAVYLAVDHTPPLDLLQRAAVGGLPWVSPDSTSSPQRWNPHITLCYVPNGVDVPQIVFEPFTVMVERVNYAREGYEDIYSTESAPMPDVEAARAAWSVVPSLDILPAELRALYDTTYADVLAETSDALKAELAAWGAVSKARRVGVEAMRAEGGAVFVDGWGALFTDEQHPDVDGIWFAREDLDRMLLPYFARAPLWLGHGFHYRDGQPVSQPETHEIPIGWRAHVDIHERGLWVSHELNPQHPQFAAIVAEAEAGRLSLSSDSIKQYVRIDTNGRMRNWPIAGWSLVPNPGEPALGPVVLRRNGISGERNVTAEAREAQRGADPTPDASRQQAVFSMRATLNHEATMNEEMLSNLRQFLGMPDASPADLATRLNELAAMLTQTEVAQAAEAVADSAASAAPAPAAPPELATMRAAIAEALNLKPDDSVAEALRAVARQLTPPTLNYDALRAMATRSATPAAAPVAPVVTRAANSPREFGAPAVVNKLGAGGGPLTQMVNDIHYKRAQDYERGPLGGYIVNQVVADAILPELRAQLAVERAGARVTMIPDAQVYQVPKMTKTPGAYWVGVNQEVPDSDAEFQTITAYPKPLAARHRMPIRMLDIVSDQVERSLREALVQSLRLEIDRAALYGQGSRTGSNTGAEPLGLKNIPGVVKTALTTAGRAPTPADLAGMKTRVQAANVELDESAHWLYHPNVLNYFENLTDANGRLLDRPHWTKGYEPIVTTAVPTNQGTNTNHTDIFFGRWSYMEIVMGQNIELITLNERYADHLQVGVVAYTFVDVIVHYPEAFQVATNVTTV